MAEYEDVRPDRRCGAFPGLDRAGARHQRQRPAGRICRMGSAGGPTKDKRIRADFYAVMPNPADGSVWGAYRLYPQRPEQKGALVRLNPGSNPPATALAEIYNIPLPGFGIRGADIDRNGVVWSSLASGHLGQFDRRKCKGPLNGPKATGDHCPEGWTFHRHPGAGFSGAARLQRRVELLHLRRSTEHVRPRREHPDFNRQSLRRRARARERPVRHAAAAVPDRPVRKGIRRPYRRSPTRVEGARPVGAERRPHAVDARNR